MTFKTATLLALETAHRAQTLSLIKINNIQICKDGFLISITDRIKTSGVNKSQPTLVINKNDNIKRCPVEILKCYLDKTLSIRNAILNLFLTFKKPCHAATSQSISRWIKHVLDLSGIDTTVYTAHSTRHASTSAAFRKGVSLEVIKKTASWSVQSTTFSRFYNKPLIEEKKPFSKAVLGKV